MNIVQIAADQKSVRILLDTLPPSQPVTIDDAVMLARDLIDAVTQCGYEVKMDVEVTRPRVSPERRLMAITRVGHLRRAAQQRPWNHTPTNSEIVDRVLEACL